MNDFVLRNLRDSTYSFTTEGATHMNFEDWPYMIPIMKRLGIAGPIEPFKAVQIVSEHLREFFVRHL